MRTSNLFLIAVVFIFGWTSTLEEQRYSVLPAGYQRVSLPVAIVGSNRAVAGYNYSGQWYPYVITRPIDRSWIREMPMQHRPNRPLHFWGNSRRRLR